MIINPYAFAKADAAKYLDQLSPAPISVYSLRKMISGATRSIRVRRSSDDAEQDIGFTGDALNTSSLMTFVGSDSGFITTFYDQTMSALNMVQDTASKQPRIVDSGIYDGAAIFDGSNDAMSITSVGFNKPQAAIYGNIKQNTTGTKIVVESSANFNTNNFTVAFYVESSTYAMGMNDSSSASQKINYAALGAGSALTQISLLYDRALTGNDETKAWATGSQKTVTNNSPYTNEQSGSFDANDIYVGARAGTSLFSDMSVESLVFYNGDSASIRGAIEGIVA